MVLNDSNWNLNSPFIYKDYGRTFLSSKLLFLTTVILGITLPEKHEANGSPSLAFWIVPVFKNNNRILFK